MTPHRHRSASIALRWLGVAGAFAQLACDNTFYLEQSPGAWVELPDTRMRDVCPPDIPEYEFTFRCRLVMAAWSGAVYDDSRRRLVVWGGGGRDYRGNEIYAFDLNDFRWSRLTEPSLLPILAPDETCPAALADGTPSPRATYGHLAYIAHADLLFAFGGSRAPCGFFTSDTWTFDFATSTWRDMQPTGTPPDRVVSAAYDPATGLVVVRRQERLWHYDLAANAWTELGGSTDAPASGGEWNQTVSVIDPLRRTLLTIGPVGARATSLLPDSTYAMEALELAGDDGFLARASAPGTAYDPERDQLVVWPSDSDSATPEPLYRLDLDDGTWTTLAVPGAPPPGAGNGTFGRWRYIPHLDAFLGVSTVDANVFLYFPDADAIPAELGSGD